YMVRPPMPPVLVLVVDVSYAAAAVGAPGVVAQALRDGLDRLPNADGRARVAIIGVDAQLHFFQMRAGAEPQQLVVGDVDDVYLPAPADLLVNLRDARAGIDAVLARFGAMFGGSRVVGNALGAAIRAAQRLVGSMGGRVVAVLASAPTAGDARVEVRGEAALGTARESELLRAQNAWYKATAAECVRAQVAVDTVFVGAQPMGVESVACLARHTGGTVRHYPAFAAGRPEAAQCAAELAQLVGADAGLEAVLRVRASKGLRMSAYYGSFFLRSLDLLALPSVPRDRCYAADVEIDEALPPVVFFQSALLHTTAAGERRIRVATIAVPTTDNAAAVFHAADAPAVAALLAKKAVDRALEARLEDAREALQHKALEVLGAFKTLCTPSASGAATQLQAPRTLRLLPLLVLAALKHPALRAGSGVRVAERIAAMSDVLTLPPEALVQPLLAARVYALHDLPAAAADAHGAVALPPRLGLSAEDLAPHGIYLVCCGPECLLWLGRSADPALVRSLLDQPSVQAVPSGVLMFPDLGPEFDLNRRAAAIIRRVCALAHDAWTPVTVVCKEDGPPHIRVLLGQRLVEDMDPAAPSYQQFLNQLRDKVNRGSF
ncbi:COPII subunit, partial [Coemansia sp. RSA 2706]